MTRCKDRHVYFCGNTQCALVVYVGVVSTDKLVPGRIAVVSADGGIATSDDVVFAGVDVALTGQKRGRIEVKKGDFELIANGRVSLTTGEDQSGGRSSGIVQITTGDSVLESGHLTIASGKGRSGSGGVTVRTGDSVRGPPGEVRLEAGGSMGQHAGGGVKVTAGASTMGRGGTVSISAGASTSVEHAAGDLVLAAGEGTGTGGGVQLLANSGGRVGGSVRIASGGGSMEAGGVTIDAGTDTASTRLGGAIKIGAGTGASQGGGLRLAAGAGTGTSGNGGGVDMVAGAGAENGGNVVVRAGRSGEFTTEAAATLVLAGSSTQSKHKRAGSVVLRAGMQDAEQSGGVTLSTAPGSDEAGAVGSSGDMRLLTGAAQQASGSIVLEAGPASLGIPGDIRMTGGQGNAKGGGSVFVKGGQSGGTEGGSLRMEGGEGAMTGGRIVVLGGHGDRTGGSTVLAGGTGGTQGGHLSLMGGNSTEGGSIPGGVVIAGGSSMRGGVGGPVTLRTGYLGAEAHVARIALRIPDLDAAVEEGQQAPRGVEIHAGQTEQGSGAGVLVSGGVGPAEGGALELRSGTGGELSGAVSLVTASRSKHTGSIFMGTGDAAEVAGSIELAAGEARDIGGSIQLKAGSGATSGRVTIQSGSGNTGGDISLIVGGGTQAAGNVLVQAGEASSATGGAVTISAGTSTGLGHAGGVLQLDGGDAAATGGSVRMTAGGSSSSVGGSVELRSGAGAVRSGRLLLATAPESADTDQLAASLELRAAGDAESSATTLQAASVAAGTPGLPGGRLALLAGHGHTTGGHLQLAAGSGLQAAGTVFISTAREATDVGGDILIKATGKSSMGSGSVWVSSQQHGTLFLGERGATNASVELRSQNPVHPGGTFRPAAQVLLGVQAADESGMGHGVRIITGAPSGPKEDSGMLWLQTQNTSSYSTGGSGDMILETGRGLRGSGSMTLRTGDLDQEGQPGGIHMEVGAGGSLLSLNGRFNATSGRADGYDGAEYGVQVHGGGGSGGGRGIWLSSGVSPTVDAVASRKGNSDALPNAVGQATVVLTRPTGSRGANVNVTAGSEALSGGNITLASGVGLKQSGSVLIASRTHHENPGAAITLWTGEQQATASRIMLRQNSSAEPGVHITAGVLQQDRRGVTHGTNQEVGLSIRLATQRVTEAKAESGAVDIATGTSMKGMTGNVRIHTGRGAVGSGNMLLTTGAASIPGGINIHAGNSSASAYKHGSADGVGGHVQLLSGSGTVGGRMQLLGGVGVVTGGALELRGGGGREVGGGVELAGGWGAHDEPHSHGGEVVIRSGDGGVAGDVSIKAGSGHVDGGSVRVTGGSGPEQGGSLLMSAGEGIGEEAVGGDVSLLAGAASYQGGSVYLWSGAATLGASGDIDIRTQTTHVQSHKVDGVVAIPLPPSQQPGSGSVRLESGASAGGSSGQLLLRTGAANTTAGNLTLQAGAGEAVAGSVAMVAGSSSTGTAGDATVSAGSGGKRAGAVRLSAGGGEQAGGEMHLQAGDQQGVDMGTTSKPRWVGRGGGVNVRAGQGHWGGNITLGMTGRITGGSFVVSAGNATTAGGDISLHAGSGTNSSTSSVLGSHGGAVSLLSGSGAAGGDVTVRTQGMVSGSIRVQTGSTVQPLSSSIHGRKEQLLVSGVIEVGTGAAHANSGGLWLSTGNSQHGVAGTVDIQAGNGSAVMALPGDVSVRAGSSETRGGDVELRTGDKLSASGRGHAARLRLFGPRLDSGGMVEMTAGGGREGGSVRISGGSCDTTPGSSPGRQCEGGGVTVSGAKGHIGGSVKAQAADGDVGGSIQLIAGAGTVHGGETIMSAGVSGGGDASQPAVVHLHAVGLGACEQPAARRTAAQTALCEDASVLGTPALRGGVTIASGVTADGPSGVVKIATADAPNDRSGRVTVQSGSGWGGSGEVTVASGSGGSKTGARSGDVTVATGAVDGTAGTAGDVHIFSGAAAKPGQVNVYAAASVTTAGAALSIDGRGHARLWGAGASGMEADTVLGVSIHAGDIGKAAASGITGAGVEVLAGHGSSAGGDVTVSGGGGGATGGSVSVTAGNAQGVAGHVVLTAGGSTGLQGRGGDVDIVAGSSQRQGGGVRILSGTGGALRSGSITVGTGPSTSPDTESGGITLATGHAGVGVSGTVTVVSGATERGASGDVTVGTGEVGSGTPGTVYIQAGANTEGVGVNGVGGAVQVRAGDSPGAGGGVTIAAGSGTAEGGSLLLGSGCGKIGGRVVLGAGLASPTVDGVSMGFGMLNTSLSIVASRRSHGSTCDALGSADFSPSFIGLGSTADQVSQPTDVFILGGQSGGVGEGVLVSGGGGVGTRRGGSVRIQSGDAGVSGDVSVTTGNATTSSGKLELITGAASGTSSAAATRSGDVVLASGAADHPGAVSIRSGGVDQVQAGIDVGVSLATGAGHAPGMDVQIRAGRGTTAGKGVIQLSASGGGRDEGGTSFTVGRRSPAGESARKAAEQATLDINVGLPQGSHASGGFGVTTNDGEVLFRVGAALASSAELSSAETGGDASGSRGHAATFRPSLPIFALGGMHFAMRHLPLTDASLPCESGGPTVHVFGTQSSGRKVQLPIASSCIATHGRLLVIVARDADSLSLAGGVVTSHHAPGTTASLTLLNIQLSAGDDHWEWVAV